MVNYTKRIIIFALARTASTSLMNIFDIHKSVRAISEPFNLGNHPNLRRMGILDICDHTISNERELDEELSRIFLKFNLVKHVWHPSGFPFSNQDESYAFNDSRSLNEYLITHFDFVVVLKRRNILKRLVSSLMSMQTGIWDSFSMLQTGRPTDFAYKPLDTNIIEWHLEYERFYEKYFLDSIRENNKKYVEITQEDFFDGKKTVDEKISAFKQICMDLELDVEFTFDQMKIIGDYLASSSYKQYGYNSYSGVPNIREIEDKYGSDETGWLFK